MPDREWYAGYVTSLVEAGVVNGYDDGPEGLMVKAATYGHWEWFSLPHLWDTGKEEKGGLVVLSV